MHIEITINAPAAADTSGASHVTVADAAPRHDAKPPFDKTSNSEIDADALDPPSLAELVGASTPDEASPPSLEELTVDIDTAAEPPDLDGAEVPAGDDVEPGPPSPEDIELNGPTA